MQPGEAPVLPDGEIQEIERGDFEIESIVFHNHHHDYIDDQVVRNLLIQAVHEIRNHQAPISHEHDLFLPVLMVEIDHDHGQMAIYSVVLYLLLLHPLVSEVSKLQGLRLVFIECEETYELYDLLEPFLVVSEWLYHNLLSHKIEQIHRLV
jgi:hypothetical protein